jgi:hypothetical protein
MSGPDDAREADKHQAAPEESGASVGTSGALAYEQARLAYSIIQTLLEHTRVTSDLVALMAQVLDVETTRAVTETPHWAAYLESRRAMERTRADIERFADEWTRMTPPDAPARESNTSPDADAPASPDASTRDSEE